MISMVRCISFIIIQEDKSNAFGLTMRSHCSLGMRILQAIKFYCIWGSTWWLPCKHHQVTTLLKSITETKNLTQNDVNRKVRGIYMAVFLVYSLVVVGDIVVASIYLQPRQVAVLGPITASVGILFFLAFIVSLIWSQFNIQKALKLMRTATLNMGGFAFIIGSLVVIMVC